MRTAGTILPAFEELFFEDEFKAVGVGVDDSVEEAADAVTKTDGEARFRELSAQRRKERAQYHPQLTRFSPHTCVQN